MSTETRAVLAARLDAALPQTQCTRCGYPDCATYAQAMAFDAAPVNRCPPGGQAGVARLAAIAGVAAAPLDETCGQEAPRLMAVIDEAWCIGCTLCLDACPTDAIVGANKRMHTVVEAHCTGCERCVPVCPVDCISLESISGDATGWAAWSQAQADAALQRYRIHARRKAGRQADAQQPTPVVAEAQTERKRSAVEMALARARARRDPQN
ncbi:RnfABCDGE type electron transport complex subunit B [Xylophilus sp. Kf1]|nr:RnfABCDGE type electron transport complex subunit B [Xylophilus sp. Kf1]